MATNLGRYSNADAFTAHLGRINLTDRQIQHLTDDEFTTMKDMVDFFQFSDIKEITKYFDDVNKTYGNSSRRETRVRFSPKAIVKITGVVWYFVHSVYSFHTVPDIATITNEQAIELGRLARELHDPNPSSDDKKSEDEVTLPTLKGAANWIDFRDKITIKISKMRNRRGISLEYLIDDTERAVRRSNAAYIQVPALDLSVNDVFKTKMIHFGPTYKLDNKKLWSLLENTLINTNPYNHISSFESSEDGRKAWFALKGYYEGEDFVQRSQDQAMNTLSNTVYRGETRFFKFEDYINSHLGAHKKLKQIGYNDGKGMDESTKIHHFKQNILPAADLENAISLARSKEKEKFSDYVTFLSTEVDFKVSRRKHLQKSGKDRNVSQLNDDRNARNNSSKFNEDNKRQMLYKTVEGKKLESRRYPRSEFSKLSKAQRDAVVSLNREKRRKYGSSNNSSVTTKNSSNIGDAKAAINSLRTDLGSFGDAIVAKVTQKVSEKPPEEVTLSSSIQSSCPPSAQSRQAAPSGSVGEFISNSRKRNQSS